MLLAGTVVSDPLFRCKSKAEKKRKFEKEKVVCLGRPGPEEWHGFQRVKDSRDQPVPSSATGEGSQCTGTVTQS